MRCSYLIVEWGHTRIIYSQRAMTTMKASLTRVMSIVMRLTAMSGIKNKHEHMSSKSNISLDES
jgi:hypothetical protein